MTMNGGPIGGRAVMTERGIFVLTGSGEGRTPPVRELDDDGDPLIAKYLHAHGPVHYVVAPQDVMRYVRRRRVLSGSLLVVLATIPIILGLHLVSSVGRADGLLRSVLEHWGLHLFVLPPWVALLPGALAAVMALAMGVFVYFMLTLNKVSPESLARARVLKQVRRDAQRWEQTRLHGEPAPSAATKASSWAGSIIAAWLGGGVVGAVLGALWRDDLATQAVSLLGPRALELVTLMAWTVVAPVGFVACGALALSPLSSRTRLVLCAVLGGITLLATAALIMVGTGNVETVTPVLITA